MEEKHQYEAPVIEIITFDFNESIASSGVGTLEEGVW